MCPKNRISEYYDPTEFELSSFHCQKIQNYPGLDPEGLFPGGGGVGGGGGGTESQRLEPRRTGGGGV